MLKIQEALDLIIEHYINELREARRGERHTIPDRYALTILEDTEAIRNYVKPVLADRIRELDEQVPKIRIEDLIGEIEGKEGKTSPVLIKGMEMPRCCGMCPCFHAETPMYCQADKTIRMTAPYGKRMEGCPLVEVEQVSLARSEDALRLYADGRKVYAELSDSKK